MPETKRLTVFDILDLIEGSLSAVEAEVVAEVIRHERGDLDDYDRDYVYYLLDKVGLPGQVATDD